MAKRFSRSVPAAILALATLAACSSATRTSTGGGVQPASARGSTAAPTTGRRISEPDVNFMSGMIPHHAQAVLIAGWAKSHGARADIVRLCERIVVGQGDEIALMQNWLKERGQDVPAADATHHKMKMNGMVHDMLMPGMLDAEQLAALDKARGSDFDRLFVQAMIAHHMGAIAMVDELLGSPDAGNDDVVYKFATDVYADQTTEIHFMQKMLATIPPSGRP